MIRLLLALMIWMIPGIASEKEIVQFKLDPQQIHTVYCHEKDSGVTTVVFPSSITNVYAARVDVKFNEKKPNPFLLSFTHGNPHFTVKSLAQSGIKGALNVIHEGKVFVIHLETVAKGYSSVTFVKPKRPVQTIAKGNAGVTPALLLSMLDKAKAYHLFKEHYPAQIEFLDYHSPQSIMKYKKHEVLLKEVIRFKDRDTLFFHLQLKNLTDKELSYDPKKLAVNLGDKIFYASMADASGLIPPKGQSSAWMAISGTKSGGKNNLAAKNDWKILLNAKEKTAEVKP